MKKFFGFGGKKGLPTSPENKRVECTSPYGYHIQEKDLGRIHKAATVGNAAKVRQILLLRKNGVNDTDMMNRTALHLACANGHTEVVTVLVKRKCRLDLVDNEKKTALIKAVQCQEEECAAILLDRGADPNVVDADGNTALHHAVLGQNTAIVTKLLAHKANMKAINKDGFTPLSLVANEKKEHMVEILVKEAAVVDPFERTALHSACADGNIEEVNILAHSKILLDLVDQENKTALIKAVQYQEEECAAILLDRGADPNVVDADGNTALHHAVLGQNMGIVAKLLAHKANTKAINKDGLTPLTLAVSDNTEDMVVFFVKETLRLKQLESNHQQTSVYETEGSSESLSESNKSLVDKKSEKDSLRSLSSKRNIDDSWPTSEDEDFDFGNKKAMNPHLAKLLAGFPRFPKTEEATKPAIEKKENDKISALGGDEDTDSPWDSESFSASLPQNYVVYLPEATDQRGKNILNGQVEDSHEKIVSSKAAVEVKDPLPKKAVGMTLAQTSRPDSPESLSSSKHAIDVTDHVPQKVVRTNSVHTSRSDSPEKISSSKAAVEVKDPFTKKTVRTTSVETSRSDSPKKISSSKAAVRVKDLPPKEALGMNSEQTSRSDSPEIFSSSKRAIGITDHVFQKVVGTNSVHTSRSDSPEVLSFLQVKQKVPVLKNAVGMNSVQTCRSDSHEKVSSSKAAVEVKDPLPKKAVIRTSAQTSRSDSHEKVSSSKAAVEVKDPLPKKAVVRTSAQTSRPDSHEKVSSSKAAVEVKDPLPKKAVIRTSAQTSRSDSHEKVSSSKAAVEVKDPLPKKAVVRTSAQTSRPDSHEKVSSSKAAVEVKDPLPKKAVIRTSAQTSRSDSHEKVSSSKAAVEVKDPLPKKAVVRTSAQTSRPDCHEKVSSSMASVEVKNLLPKKAVIMTSAETSRRDSHEEDSSSKAAAEVKNPLPKKALRTNSVQTFRSDSEKNSCSKPAVEVKDPVSKKSVRENSVQLSRSAKLDLEVASGEEEERLDGSENNHPHVSDSYEKGKRLLHEKHILQAKIAKLQLEIDTIKNQNQEMEEKYFEDIVIVKENNDILQKTIKVNEEAFTKTISQYNGQFNVLTAENTILKSKLETERQTKERLETEIESYRARLATAVQDHEQSETSKGDLQRDFQRARDEWFRLRDKMNCDISDLEDKNDILSQQLSEAESKFNSLEIELHHTRDALRERTLVLEGVQRDLSQTQCQKEEIEHMYQKEQDKVNKYSEKQGSLEERLSQLQSENELLRQQLDDAHNKVYKREKTVIEFKDQLQDIMKMFQDKSEKHALMLNERNTELINVCNRLKERMHEYENSKSEKDATMRQLQQELAGTLKNQSVSEASLQTTSHSHMNLEDAALDIKKKLDRSTSQNDDLTAKPVTVSSKCLNLDGKNKCLRQELVSMKTLQKKYEKLKNKKRVLKQEIVNLKRHTLVNMAEFSKGEQYRQKAEERARRDIESKSEVSRFSQTQATSQENLKKLREIHYALVIRQLEFKSNHLESELSKIKTSHDSKETDLEKYRQLYLKEIESKESLRNELNKAKERLAEANTELLLRKWQNRSSLSTFKPKPDRETPYDEHSDSSSLYRNPTQRDKSTISISKAWTSPDLVMKMRQEVEKTLEK